jgi:saccharopine dehydrogenase-like NADP-dependent oxidoreductase
MKCIVLGGAGAMGATACRHLAAADGIGEVVVADRDGARAARIAEELAGARARVTSRAVDLQDGAATRALSRLVGLEFRRSAACAVSPRLGC